MNKIKSLSVLVILIFSFLLTACGSGIAPIKGDKNDRNVVANVLGVPVYLDEVKYLVHNFKIEMQSKYGDDIWDTPENSEKYRDELTERVENAMLKNPAFVSACKDHGIDIESKDTEKKVKEYIDNFAEQIGGKEEYIKQLSESGMTDRYLRYTLAVEFSKEALRQALCAKDILDDSDETARKAIEGDEFIRTLHVLVKNDEGEDIEENRKKAEKVLEGLSKGEPFNRMIGRYSEDVLMTTTDGYYFMKGEYELAYEEAAFALGVNEVSEIIEGSAGFYVIKRLPKEEEYIEKNFESLKDRFIFVMFEQYIENRSSSAELEYTEYGKKLDFLNLK